MVKKSIIVHILNLGKKIRIIHSRYKRSLKLDIHKHEYVSGMHTTIELLLTIIIY